ncbi:hypothetical protein [Microbacterium sp. CPCC 204701]|nr:hypothetical protein [Microbacterium sp. CPCC 204701]
MIPSSAAQGAGAGVLTPGSARAQAAASVVVGDGCRGPFPRVTAAPR